MKGNINQNIKGRLNAAYLKRFPYRLNWLMNFQCNLNCTYCNTPQSNQFKDYLKPSDIERHFNQTEKNWLILLTGGEPFLYPDFVEVCENLTKNNHITITTNLTHQSVPDFADKIDPQKVLCISASMHDEQLKEKNLRKRFIENCLYLKQKEFCLLVNFVAYPPNIPNIEANIQELNKLGIECIVYGFRGKYEEKEYPNSYTPEETEFLRKHALDETELMIADNQLKFNKHLCNAGSSYFVMKPNGDLQACFTHSIKIGNLFKGDIKLDSKCQICKAEHCHDYYFGRAAVGKKANILDNLTRKKRILK